MKIKTTPKEEYPLTENQFTNFAKGIVCVSKKQVDKQLAKHEHKNNNSEPTKA